MLCCLCFILEGMPLQYLTRIAQTPAPTFEEETRAALVAELWRGFGYQPTYDAAGNILLRLDPPHPHHAIRPSLALLIHLDTVFSAETNLSVRQEGNRLYGAGLGDNSASLAVVTAWLREFNTKLLNRPLWIVATTGEEGLGNLRGATHFLSEHQAELGAVIAIDGYLGSITTKAIGVTRLEVTFKGLGGHAWTSRNESAIYAASRAISALYGLHLPLNTTLNVGLVSGGSSINSVAEQARFALDLRSASRETLATLEEQVQRVVNGTSSAKMHSEIRLIGQRPGGDLHNKKLRETVHYAAKLRGLKLTEIAGSTDANATVPYGIPALTLGVYRGGHAHQLDEWIEPKSLNEGLNLLQCVIESYQHRPIR